MENEKMIKYNKFGWVDLSKLKYNKNGTISWKNSVGCQIHFKYKDVESDIIILEYINAHSMKICVINYTDEYTIGSDDILNGKLGGAVKKITREFRYRIGDIVNDNLLITSTYRKGNCKYYTYQCLIDGYNGSAYEENIKKGSGCPVCAGKTVLVGYNDIATVRPDVAILFLNPDDALKYSEYSHQYTYFKCPRCGNVIYTSITTVSYYGLHCRMCSDGISYSEKFVFNCLQQICNLHKENEQLQNFETQKTFEWSKNIQCANKKLSGDKIYDFYIPLSNKIIIETHGEQHFKHCFFHTRNGSKTLEEEQKNDELKMNLAISNNILSQNYIQLDCRYSNMDYIKNSIMSSILPELLNFSVNDINWYECNSIATSSRVYEACELWNEGVYTVNDIANKMKLTRATIRNYLRRSLELGILRNPPKYLLKD